MNCQELSVFLIFTIDSNDIFPKGEYSELYKGKQLSDANCYFYRPQPTIKWIEPVYLLVKIYFCGNRCMHMLQVMEKRDTFEIADGFIEL